MQVTHIEHCLPPLAAVFSFPGQNTELSSRLDAIIIAGEYATSVVFKSIREALADGEGGSSPMEMEILSGVMGTGVTLLETAIAIRQKDMDATKLKKLYALLEEYKKLFEDIELFSRDIPSEDCLRASCAGKVYSDLNTPEEDDAWRDL